MRVRQFLACRQSIIGRYEKWNGKDDGICQKVEWKLASEAYQRMCAAYPNYDPCTNSELRSMWIR